MMDIKQFAAPFSLPSTPTDGIPLAAAKNPLGMSMGTSRFAGGIPKDSTLATSKNTLSMSMGTSRFAGSVPKDSTTATSKAEVPKANWNRELDFSGNTKTSPPGKKGEVRHNKRKTPRTQARQAPSRNSGPSNPATSTVLLPVAPAVVTAPVTPSKSPTNAVSLRPTAPEFVPRPTAAVVTPPLIMSEPSSRTGSADSSEPSAENNWKETSKVQKEHIIYLQKLFKEGLKKDEIAERTAAEFPELCKGMRNGCKTATEETRVEAVGDAVFMHTRRYAHWYV